MNKLKVINARIVIVILSLIGMTVLATCYPANVEELSEFSRLAFIAGSILFPFEAIYSLVGGVLLWSNIS